MGVPDFEAWDLFVAVAEAGSFAGAARARNLSVPTVSRAIARLEARLGAALFHRTSRRLSLSGLGRDALAEAQALVQAGQQMEDRLGEATVAPSGLIRLAAPLDFGREHIAPLLPAFLAAHPQLAIELHLDDARIDIVASGHDLVLRIGQLADSSLIARRLCPVKLLTVAAPAYLDLHGRPRHPADLARHRCLLYTNSLNPFIARFSGPDASEYSVTLNGPLRANSGSASMPALLDGIGIAILPDFMVSTHLESGQLEALLPDWNSPAMNLFLITPPSALRPARVRLLMDYLAEKLRNPAWVMESSPGAER